jgi:3-hydroxybutyryl-CoA dehydrogenase
MGASIAQVAASAGFEVRLYDIAEPMIERGLANIRDSLDRFVQRGRLDAVEADAALGRLATSVDLAAFEDVDFAIEAAPEDIELKERVVRQLDQVLAQSAIIASNTSSLSITELAASTERPELVVGMHFFNPPVLMDLVEVARAAQSAPETVRATLDLARRFGKTPVEVADTPGFIVNRIARPFYLEALRILGEGLADVPTIDGVLRQGGFKMGPFELMDLIGVDVNLAVTQSIYEQSYFEPRFRPHPLQRQMVRANRLGRKTGRGFYEYDPPVGGRRSAADGPESAVSPAAGRRPPPEPVAIAGEGALAVALRELAQEAGLAVTDNVPEAGLMVVAGLGPLEVRRLAIRTALEQAAEGALLLAHCAPHSVTEVTSTLKRPEVAAGFAIGGDPREAKMVEVAGGLRSSQEAVEAGLAFFTALGKEAVHVGDGPGMILARVVSMLANEAASALEDGVASAQDIDTAMKLGVAYPFGPLEWADRLGLDLVYQTVRTLQQDYGDDRYRPAVRLRRLAQAGGRFREGGQAG